MQIQFTGEDSQVTATDLITGVVALGKTKEDAYKNLQNAVNEFYAENEDSVAALIEWAMGDNPRTPNDFEKTKVNDTVKNILKDELLTCYNFLNDNGLLSAFAKYRDGK